MTAKAKNTAYWITIILVAFFIGGGSVAQMAILRGNAATLLLGYPLYFFHILGFWKILGAIAILVPRFPRLKEWAYAGIFFDLTGAAASVAQPRFFSDGRIGLDGSLFETSVQHTVHQRELSRHCSSHSAS